MTTGVQFTFYFMINVSTYFVFLIDFRKNRPKYISVQMLFCIFQTLLECVRLKTFSKYGLQQVQVDTHYLQLYLWSFLHDEKYSYFGPKYGCIIRWSTSLIRVLFSA